MNSWEEWWSTQEVYQQEIGRTGTRECATRYEAIRKVLSRYTRPFTLFDLGAAQGYFGIHAAQQFSCTSILAERDPRLKAIVADAPRVIVLERDFTAEDLADIAQCERVDVVLALNVLHHFTNWRSVLESLCSMSDHLIVETPDPSDEGACGESLLGPIFNAVCAGKNLGRFDSHTSKEKRWMFMLSQKPIPILKPMLGAHLAYTNVSVDSDWYRKTAFFPAKGEHREWIQGINLFTYCSMGGVVPNRAKVGAMLREFPLPVVRHGDMKAWNFILDGERLHLIDGRDERANFDDAEAMAETIAMVEDTCS